MEILLFILVHLTISLIVTLVICAIEDSWEMFLQGWLMMLIFSIGINVLVTVSKAVYHWVNYWSSL